VVQVWISEAKKFTPDIRVTKLSGTPDVRRQILLDSDNWDVLVTNYAIVRNDIDQIHMVKFDSIILDEAQQIKNPQAQVTVCIKSIDAENRIALTGTPLENRLLDLWSIVDFLLPQFLGDEQDFLARYDGSRFGRERLAKRIAPLMLRRTKDAVAPELPPRSEEVVILPMSEKQQSVYNGYLSEARRVAQSKGTMAVLAALTRLRQICCHPQLVTDPEKDGMKQLDSAKLDCLLGMIEELTSEGHSALIFSQFVGMLDIIEEEMKKRKQSYFKIIGQTSTDKRQKQVDAFNKCKDPSVFLLSLRAAGTGLTLTKADYVFIFDPWWNPAVENQAIDRTHRIGQDKPVMAYRLVMAGSVEEKVLAMQDEKRQLFEEMIEGTEQMPTGLTAQDLIALLD